MSVSEQRTPNILCQTHQGFSSKSSAKMAVRKHLRLPCGKCRAGWVIEWFLCTTVGHYHIGHRPSLAIAR